MASRPLFLFLLLTGLSSIVRGQYQFDFLHHLENAMADTVVYQLGSPHHGALRPLNRWAIDSIKRPFPQESAAKAGGSGWLYRKAFVENLVQIDRPEYALTINPVVNFQGSDMSNTSYVGYVNTRGYLLEGRIGQDLTFYSTFLENQGRYAPYMRRYAAEYRVIPGQGSTVRGFGDRGVDYSLPAGAVAYSPGKHFSFSLGQGRHFLGEGYRSLFLSDFSFSYPYFRIETQFGPVKYLNLWAQLYDTRQEARAPAYDNVYGKKYLSSHYLSINIGKRWNIAFFEAIILGDTTQQRGLDASFFNPVIFYRPIEFAVGSGSGNALLGGALSYKIMDGYQAYGQFLLDEFSIEDLLARNGSWVNKYAWQIGLKHYGALGIPGLFARLEYNGSRPYNYSHRTVLTNYAHYGSPLAHPYGANFHELLGQLLYRQERWEFEGRLIYALRGMDDEQNYWGTDLYRSYNQRVKDQGNWVGQGLSSHFWYGLARVAYRVNPASNLKLEAGLRWRSLQPRKENIARATAPFATGNLFWGFIGLRTALFNQYFDF